MLKILLVLSFISIALCGALFELKLLDQNTYPEAKCLDGTVGGYYISKGKPGTRNWMIWFQGGGWCYELNDCYTRAHTTLGSSKYFPKTYEYTGMLSNDCKVNPQFCDWNRIILQYCDGMSFTGMRNDPIPFNGTRGPVNLWFKGRNILDSIMDDLTKTLGYGQAEEVVLTGCSAGGLASYFHADYFAQKWLPSSTKKYGIAPESGFFLNHNNAYNVPVYPDQMKVIFNLANSSYGVNQDCIFTQSQESQWLCAFAEYNYPYIKSPIFVINSVYDSWQTGCILTSVAVPTNFSGNGECGAALGWNQCANKPETCTSQQLTVMNLYKQSFVDRFNSASNSKKNGNGAFLNSCFYHCASISPGYNTYTIDGSTLQNSFFNWWNSNFTQSADKHTFFPCEWKTTQPHNCNPTCGSG